MITDAAPRANRDTNSAFLLNAVVEEEIEICQIDDCQCKTNGSHRLVAPFPQCEGEIGESASGYNSGEDIPVEVNQVCLVKTEDIGRVRMLEHMLSGHKRENSIQPSAFHSSSVGLPCTCHDDTINISPAFRYFLSKSISTPALPRVSRAMI